MTPHEFDRFVAAIPSQPPPTQDAVLITLRSKGASMVQAIKAIRQVFGLSLGQSKVTVARHPSWALVHRTAQPIHDALERLAAESSDDIHQSARRAH
jgi:ribosomal protein L7/L12